MVHKIENEINKVFVGKEEVVRKLLTCMLAGGHVLLEDVPGVGKTTLAAALAGVCPAALEGYSLRLIHCRETSWECRYTI